MKKEKTLLAIGGTGVLSNAVVLEAIRQGIDVTIVTRGKSRRKIPYGVKSIIADYRNEDSIKAQLKEKHFDTVIDFICYNKQQIEYSINLLHEYANQYIFISSACVYDAEISGIKEETAKQGLHCWNYSLNKMVCEQYLKEQAALLGFNYTIVRPCITYDDTRIPYGAMPLYGFHWSLIARILNEKPIIRWNGGNNRWNMMRVEDFAIGVVGLIANCKSYGEAYNISGDEAYTWNDVIKTICNIIGKKPIFFDISAKDFSKLYPGKTGEIMGRSHDYVVSNEKIKQLIPEFRTRINLSEGISRTINAYTDKNYQKGIDWKWDAQLDYIVAKQSGDSVSYNINYIDYLHQKSVKNKIIYYLTRYQDIFIIRLITTLIKKGK